MTVSRETIRAVTMGRRASDAWSRQRIMTELGRLRGLKLDVTTPSAKITVQGQIDLLLDTLNAFDKP